MTPDRSPLVLRTLCPSGAGVEALIEVTDHQWIRTSARPGLADKALALLPGLARHRCECGSAHGIKAELADTETPHLIEHVALELLALDGWPRDTAGRTRWDFARDGRGVFRVWIGCEDLEAARAAFEGAITIAGRLLSSEAERPDTGTLVARTEAPQR